MRVFYLDQDGPRERWAGSGTGLWSDWWQLVSRVCDSQPADTRGGAITSIGYGGEEARIYYMSGGAILEVGLSMSIRGWWCGNHID